MSLWSGQAQLYLKSFRVIIWCSETPFHVGMPDCLKFNDILSFLATDLNSNDSYGTVVNLGMEQDGSSPHSAGSRAPHFTLHGGPATPPYLSSSHSPTPPHPALGPNFPYSTGEGLAVYTTLGKSHVSLWCHSVIKEQNRQTHRKFAGWDGSVGIATCYGLDCLAVESRGGWGRFFTAVQTGLEGFKSPDWCVSCLLSTFSCRVAWDCCVCLRLRGVVNKFPDWIFRARTEFSHHTSR